MQIAVSNEGRRFIDGPLDLQWPRGGGKRSVATVPDDRAEWSVRLRKAFEGGRVVEFAGKVPKAAPQSPAGPSMDNTKKELLAAATAAGVEATDKMTKTEILAALEAGPSEPAPETSIDETPATPAAEGAPA